MDENMQIPFHPGKTTDFGSKAFKPLQKDSPNALKYGETGRFPKKSRCSCNPGYPAW